jgi:hypothetical protein
LLIALYGAPKGAPLQQQSQNQKQIPCRAEALLVMTILMVQTSLAAISIFTQSTTTHSCHFTLFVALSTVILEFASQSFEM